MGTNQGRYQTVIKVGCARVAGCASVWVTTGRNGDGRKATKAIG